MARLHTWSSTMSPFFRVEMLPALHGDCIWIEYGRPGEIHYLLIDGGPIQAYGALQSRLERVDADKRLLELLVITHVDADHIEGAIKLLNHPELKVRFGDVWFNGWPQLEKAIPKAAAVSAGASNERGPTHGEYLALRIAKHGAPWNRWFGGRAIHVAPEARGLPMLTLEGGMQVTLLGPMPAKLEELRTEWDRVARSIGARPGDAAAYSAKLDAAGRYRGVAAESAPVPSDDVERLAPRLDPSIANGSSIALLLEFEGRRCALLGDAHTRETEVALRVAARDRGESVLRLDAMKVSHHGSVNNISDSLLASVDCAHYLISSDGSKHGHPDAAAIECIVRGARRPHLVFNYRSKQTQPWAEPARQEAMNYRATLPRRGEAGAIVDLMDDAAAARHD